ncbi:cytosol aminopeptidase-like isoform X1 [Nymphalis io]|uniref:cytosol aminopeptidase-like isoform X1 n=1 Tax=Inachis io TaxID=171585 RepID=UPI00216966ED|nr:cytosol aminopeptidase-like isoform X1 [Nymphalis io]
MGYAKLFSSIYLWRVNSGRLFRFCSSVVHSSECDAKTGKKTKNEAHDTNSEENKSGLVIGVYEEKDKFELTPAAEEINQRSGGKLCKYLNELSCHLKLGKAFVVTDVVLEFGPVAISSLGKKDPGYNKLEELDETRENVRVMVGAGVRALCERGCARVSVCAAGAPHAAAEAAHLAAWRFEEFKSSADRHQEVQLSLHGSEGQEEWDAGVVYGQSQNWARYLTDMPPNKMTPVDFAQAALDTLCPLGVHVTAHERAWLEAQRMRGVLAVAAGSCEAPLLLECAWRGADNPPVLLAADGLTFDCGGLCLRSARDMHSARSVTGAAVVLAVLRTLALLKVPLHVRAVIPLCEQLVSGHCLKPGDVLPALNGLHMQVEDTDLESQLMLADALVYGQAIYKPSLVIDVASLAPVGASNACACVFTNSEHVYRGARDAGARTGDRLWRLPLWDYYRRQVRDDPAVDLRNKGSGTATICKGAAFLKHFVCGEWLHVDTSGVRAGGAVYLRHGRAAGRPARTIAAFLADAALADKHADSHADKHADTPRDS